MIKHRSKIAAKTILINYEKNNFFSNYLSFDDFIIKTQNIIVADRSTK